MNARVRALEQRIERIKHKLAAIGDLRPGSVSEQYNVCGSPSCRCKANPPQRHGPYYQLSWTRNRRSKTRFVRRPELAAVQTEIRNYKRLQGLVGQWIELAT